jgi:hypothetical protein
MMIRGRMWVALTVTTLALTSGPLTVAASAVTPPGATAAASSVADLPGAMTSAVDRPASPLSTRRAPGVGAAVSPSVAGVVGVAGSFVSLAPARVLDTRSGVGATQAQVPSGGTVHLQVAGQGGVPGAGVPAVVLNVTVTEPTRAGYVTVHADGAGRPTASNLNFVAGQTVPNLVIAPVGSNGKVALYNGSAGTISLIADVSGYYLSGTPTDPGAFASLAPARVLDTRSGVGAPNARVAAGGTVHLQVAGRGGVPATGVSAVVLNVTVTGPTRAGYLMVYGDGVDWPNASNLNFVPNQTVPNLVIAPLGSNGKIALYNGSAGTTNLIADVAGYYRSGTLADPGAFASTTPDRVLDTRSGVGAPNARVAAGGTVHLQVAGQGEVRDRVSAVVLNVTVTAPTKAGYVTAYADGASRPTASNLNFVAGQTVPNLVIAPVGSNGKIALYNGSAGTTNLIADVAGYYLAGPVGALKSLGTVDWTSTSSYSSWNWANPDSVYYYRDGTGNLDVVTHHPDENNLTIETFDLSSMAQVSGTKSISLAAWPDWGGFYAGPDGYFYVLVGRDNPTESDSLNVGAVRRYDPNWSLVGTAYVPGGVSQGVKGIYRPFQFSAAHMVLVGQRLVVDMGRLIYAIGGVHHQANLTFEVNVGTLKATVFEDLGGYAYSSHSFQQLVAMNGSNLVTIDHGDAYPRAIQLGVMADYPNQREVTTYDLFEFNGAIGDNFTGATVTGLVSGPSGVVVLGNSIRQPNAPNGTLGSDTERRNIYAIWADPSTGAHTVHWLTTLSPTGSEDALEPRVVRVGTDLYAVMFSVQSSSGYRTEYRLINSTGSVIAAATFPGMFFNAASDPILVGDRIYWAGLAPDEESIDYQTGYLFGMDVSNPSAPKLLRN